MSNISVTRFSLDVRSPRSQVTLHVGQYDTSRTWKISLYDGGKPISLSDLTPYMTITRPDGSFIQNFCHVENDSEAVYGFSDDESNKSTAFATGEHLCQLTLVDPDGRDIATAEFSMVVTERLVAPADLSEFDEETVNIVYAAVTNERERMVNENARIENENTRKDNENSRTEAERLRRTAEDKRVERDLRRFISANAVEGGHSVTITNPDGSIQSFFIPKGEKGDKGDPFTAKKTYSSVADMEADFANAEVPEGSFIVIDTGNVEDEENARLYIKSATGFAFITDLSGAEGIKGDPGVSPSVTVTDIVGGHRVTITDAAGTHAFDVANGNYSPQKGSNIKIGYSRMNSLHDALSTAGSAVTIDGFYVQNAKNLAATDFEYMEKYIGYLVSVYSHTLTFPAVGLITSCGLGRFGFTVLYDNAGCAALEDAEDIAYYEAQPQSYSIQVIGRYWDYGVASDDESGWLNTVESINAAVNKKIVPLTSQQITEFYSLYETTLTDNYKLGNSVARGLNSIAFGNGCVAEGTGSVAMGTLSIAGNKSSVAMGTLATCYGSGSASLGYQNKVLGNQAFAAGANNIVESHGGCALGRGNKITVDAQGALVEGENNTVSGRASHAEGGNTTASGSRAHAEGEGTMASGAYSHSGGYSTVASGAYSHSGGYGTVASGEGSFSNGVYTIAKQRGQTALGICNKDEATALLIVGAGEHIYDQGDTGLNIFPYNCFTAGVTEKREAYIKIGDTELTEAKLNKLLALLDNVYDGSVTIE